MSVHSKVIDTDFVVVVVVVVVCVCVCGSFTKDYWQKKKRQKK